MDLSGFRMGDIWIPVDVAVFRLFGDGDLVTVDCWQVGNFSRAVVSYTTA